MPGFTSKNDFRPQSDGSWVEGRKVVVDPVTASRSQNGPEHVSDDTATSTPAPSAACSRCPLEHGCGDFEVCRIMSMSDEEIIATTPDAERVAEEMRQVLLDALDRRAEPAPSAAGEP
jgi:hypothetical protein